LLSDTENQDKRSMLDTVLGRGWPWVCIAIAILALCSRLLFLSEKPFHHDESLHAYYSNRVAHGHPHEYSALLHGPVLYYLVGAFMAVFGTGEFNARFPAAAANILLVLLPLLWSRSLGRVAALAISVFFLVSPTFMYFGRFLREDGFNSLWIAASLAGFFSYYRSGKPWHAVAATAFLAMQFCNKENSYLHVVVWLSGWGVALWLIRRAGLKELSALRGPDVLLASRGDRMALILNCISVFVVIFILFYSSFFRHSKGALHGVIDGLYRESLLYWWEQNKKRRIDGPFDYHFPLLFNYEFALLPALFIAWLRSVWLACAQATRTVVQQPYTIFKKKRTVLSLGLGVLLLVALPRIGLTPDGCSISEFCASHWLGNSVWDGRLNAFAKALHLSHSRHLFQIFAISILGAIALLASAYLRRPLDAFLWWWATGMLGIYSYVGEKVPWLLIYILLPLVVIAGLELGRLWRPQERDLPLLDSAVLDSDGTQLRENETAFNHKWSIRVGVFTCLLMAFGSWKAIRVSFLHPASTDERLVFTQTTPKVKLIRERWVQLSHAVGQTPKVTMAGDATWPMAWYAFDLTGTDFVRPANAAAAERFDAIFLDVSELDFARREMQSFNIYKVPLRHWWVPKPNPRPVEILEYFLTNRPYPRELRNSPPEMGMGDTQVLYLENKKDGKFFANAPDCPCGEKVESAKFSPPAPIALPMGGVPPPAPAAAPVEDSKQPAERKK
jgi:uncharacterized protein (TIGR03663 family)